MADLTNNTNNYKKLNEVLDLRDNAEGQIDKQAVRIELPTLPEQLETINNGNFENNHNQAVIKERGVQSIPGSIISQGQSRALTEQRAKEIENILASGLDNLFMAMDKDTQTRFKIAGEEATRSINNLIDQGKCSLKKVLEIIKGWLTLIPGVNRFFLEQEAKIKADKIMNIQRNYG